jgi:hypothetical protein
MRTLSTWNGRGRCDVIYQTLYIQITCLLYNGKGRGLIYDVRERVWFRVKTVQIYDTLHIRLYIETFFKTINNSGDL